ncbi:hypothetical protein ACOME3_009117 [Neoechinorhynchus agilis]
MRAVSLRCLSFLRDGAAFVYVIWVRDRVMSVLRFLDSTAIMKREPEECAPINYDDDDDGGGGDELDERDDDESEVNDGFIDDGDDDDRLILPRSVIGKVIKEVSNGTRVSSESRELISLCCHEFVNVLCDRSSRLCEKQQKKLIGADHILAALTEMGLSSYVSDCHETMNAATEEAAEKRRRMSSAAGNGWSQDDLYRRQMELFAQAKESITRVHEPSICTSQENNRDVASQTTTTTTTHEQQPPNNNTFRLEDFVQMLRRGSTRAQQLTAQPSQPPPQPHVEDYDQDPEEG